MKKTLLACLLGTVTISAFAADTVDLKVTGTLINAACTPSLTNNGVDFGKTALSALSATDVNQLGFRDTTLTISCDSATAVAFTSTDNRADSLQLQKVGSVDGNSIYGFGLGKTADGVKLGAYTVTVNSADIVADGSTDKLLLNVTPGSPAWQLASQGASLRPDAGAQFTVGGSDKVPVAFKSAAFPLRVTASVQDTGTLAIKDDTNLDGLTTISLVYL